MKNLKAAFVVLLFALSVVHGQPSKDEWKSIIPQARQFITFLEKQQFDKAVSFFDANMRTALPEQKLQAIWLSLQNQAGSFVAQKSVSTEKIQNYRIVYVTCQFKKTILDAKIVFNEKDQIAGLFFVPHVEKQSYQIPAYVDTSRFLEIDTLRLPTTWKLPLSLSLPNGEGPFPAIVLVHGSGPNDRDETIGPNKPFRDLAWGLASRGIAVLRYEKRTRVYPNVIDSLKGNFTLIEETVEDALAGVSFLRSLAEIDPDRVIVLGHSLGGYSVPLMARYYPRLAGFVILAGSARPLPELMRKQYRYIFNLDGKIDANEQKKIDEIDSLTSIISSLDQLDAMNPTSLVLGAPPAYWKYLLNYDPMKLIERVRKPVLVLQGGRDYQVTTEDFDLWKEHLKSNSKATFKFYPTLNHLFMQGSAKPGPQDYQQPGHVDANVIEDIAQWIHSQF